MQTEPIAATLTNGSGEPQQPETASVDLSMDKSPRPKKPRRARESTARYPCYVTCNLTAAMGQSLMRLTQTGPVNQSTYLRMILHAALLKDDPLYAQDMM